MLIGITLAFLLVITFLSIISGNSFIGIVTENIVDNAVIVNGTTTTLEIPIDDVVFGLDPITGGLALIVTLAVLGGLITVQILGSGMSSNGSRIIMVSVFYGGLWTILSLMSYPMIVSIDIFGVLLYLTLTILFGVGVVSKYFGGDTG